jgi:hypothetical protein
MDITAAAELMEAISASGLQLAGVLRGTVADPSASLADGLADDKSASLEAGRSSATSWPTYSPATGTSAAGPSAVDPAWDLARWQAEACLTVLSGAAGMEAMFAAVKVHAASGYDEAAQLIAGPINSPQEQTAQEMGIQAEVACVLTVSERTAGGLLGEALRLGVSDCLCRRAVVDG